MAARNLQKCGASVVVISAAVFVLLLFASGSADAQKTEPPIIPESTGYVSDYAGVMDTTTKDQLETTLSNLDRRRQIQFAVVTIETTRGQDIFDYSRAVAQKWGIGSKDTKKSSLLLLVAMKDRKYFTQVSRSLGAELSDEVVGRIQRERLVPAFRIGQYGKGLLDTIDAYITVVEKTSRFSIDDSATAVPSSRSEATNEPQLSIVGEESSRLPIVLALLILAVLGGAYFIHRFRSRLSPSVRGRNSVVSVETVGNLQESDINNVLSTSDRVNEASKAEGESHEMGSAESMQELAIAPVHPTRESAEPIFREFSVTPLMSGSGATLCQECGDALKTFARFCETCGFDAYRNQLDQGDVEDIPAPVEKPIEERLSRLAELKVQGLINEEEYQVRRQRILDEI